MDWSNMMAALQQGHPLGSAMMSAFAKPAAPAAAPGAAPGVAPYNGLAQPATAAPMGPPSGTTVQAATAELTPYQQGLQLAQQQLAAAQPAATAATTAGMAGGGVPAMPQQKKQGGSAFSQIASLFA